MNLLKLVLTFLSSSIILNAGTVSWSSGVGAPIDESVWIVLFAAILFIGLWFSRKAPTSLKISLVALVLVSGAYEYNLNAAPKTITMSSPSGSDTFVDADGFVLVNSSGRSVSVTITPGAGYSCPTGGCKRSVPAGASSTLAMVTTESSMQTYLCVSHFDKKLKMTEMFADGTISKGFSINTVNGFSKTEVDYETSSVDFHNWLVDADLFEFVTNFSAGGVLDLTTNTANENIEFTANGTELETILRLNGQASFGSCSKL